MAKVNFQEFYAWRQAWYLNHPRYDRLGQAFCNHFIKEIGQGNHTFELWYCLSSSDSEKIIYENFIDFN